MDLGLRRQLFAEEVAAVANLRSMGRIPALIEPKIEGRPREEVAYHLKLLGQAGYIDAEPTGGIAAFRWGVRSMTWEGHDFLDAIRNDTIWNRVKATVTEKGGGASVEVMKAIAIQIGKRYFVDSP